MVVKRGRAPFGPTLALTVTAAAGCFLLAMAVVLLVTRPTEYAGLLAGLGEQNQNAKTGLYLATFTVILPLALIAVPRLADAVATGPNAPALPILAAGLAGTLALAILAVKLSGALPWGDGVGVVLTAVGLWGAAACGALARARRPRPWPALLSFARFASAAWVLAGVLAFGALLCVVSLRSLSVVPVVLGAIAVPTVLFLRERLPPLTLRRPWGAGIDVAIVVLVVLAVPDLVILMPHGVLESPFSETRVIQFQQHFLLGPANQVLGGDVMLVDTSSQYGIGLILALVAWFHVAPIGYGTLGLFDGIVTALLYAAAYGLLRLAGTSRLLAACAVATGVVALIYNLRYPVGGLPEQGTLRFGLPLLAILAGVVAARRPGRASVARGGALLTVAVASIWALEAFAYTLVTLAVMACVQASLLPAGRRLRWLARRAGEVAAACVCAHLIFAGATLAASGELPHWGQYLTIIRSFLFGKQAQLTFAIARWSPGLAVGAAYLASLAAVVLLVLRAPELARRERPSVIAVAGTTAWGIGLFSYFDNRSATFILPYVALPVLLVAALWLSLLLRSSWEVPRAARLAALALGLSAAVLVLAAAWPSVGERLPRSALAHVVPGGDSMGAALRRLWHLPPVDPRATQGVLLLHRYMPGQRRSLVLIVGAPDLTTEVLLRSRRANLLPLGWPIADSFEPSVRIPGLRRAVARLVPGQRLLIDEMAFQVLAALRARPALDPLTDNSLGLREPLQAWILVQIARRFELRPISRPAAGLTVVELVPRG